MLEWDDTLLCINHNQFIDFVLQKELFNHKILFIDFKIHYRLLKSSIAYEMALTYFVHGIYIFSEKMKCFINNFYFVRLWSTQSSRKSTQIQNKIP